MNVDNYKFYVIIMKPFLFGGIANNLPDFEVQVCVLVDNYETNRIEFKKSKYKIFIQIEPPEINNLELLIKIQKKFDLILTWNEEVLGKCSNAKFFVFGTCWIDKKDQKIYKKSKDLSIISSDKHFLEGHRLRHEIIAKFENKMDVFGRGYKFIENKSTALADYRFSLIIENVRHNNWFTEKLIDSLRTGTIPIYWGAQNISKFFNPKGFIFFDNIAHLDKILNNLNDDLYLKNLKYVKENFELADYYSKNYFERIHKEISDFIQMRQSQPFLTKLIKGFRIS